VSPSGRPDPRVSSSPEAGLAADAAVEPLRTRPGHRARTTRPAADLLAAVESASPSDDPQRPVVLGAGGVIVVSPDASASIWLIPHGATTVVRWQRTARSTSGDAHRADVGPVLEPEHESCVGTAEMIDHVRRHGVSYTGLTGLLTREAA
jgi:hypothetical protein